MKLFFLGGTSYLGKELIKRLQSQNHELTVFVRNVESARKLEGLNVSVTDEASVDKLPFQDLVFNLVVDYGKNKSLDEVLNTNVLFPLHVLEKISFKTVINFSTALDKDLSHYAFTKRLLESSLCYLGKQKNWQVINLQLQHFFGPEAPDHNFVTFLIKKMISGEEIPLTDCQQRRDFIFTSDLLDAIEFIIQNLKNLPQEESLDIGSGIAIKLRDFVETINNLCHSKSNLQFGSLPKRRNEPSELKADIQKLQSLGWSPKTPVEQALSITIDHIKAKR